jgi:hypothetical protein
MTPPAGDCMDIRQALGVYVLGAIDPADRSQVDRHVTSCRECRDELAGLAGLPALLSHVDADEAGRISLEDTAPAPAGATPPEDFAESLLSLTAARTRQRRRQLRRQAIVAAAAAAIAAAGTTAVWGLSSGPAPAGRPAATAPPASWATAHTTSALRGITATVRYSEEPWGTAMDIQITGAADGITCQLWVTSAHGGHLPVAGWTVSGRGTTAWYPGSSWVPASQVQGFDVTAGSRQLAAFIPH